MKYLSLVLLLVSPMTLAESLESASTSYELINGVTPPVLTFTANEDGYTAHFLRESNHGKVQRVIISCGTKDRDIETLTYDPLDISWDALSSASLEDQLHVLRSDPLSDPVRKIVDVSYTNPEGYSDAQMDGFWDRVGNLGKHRYNTFSANNATESFIRKSEFDAVIIEHFRKIMER